MFADLLDFLRKHAPTIALSFTWIGIAILAVRRRLHWKRKSFLTLVNFSLNYRVGDALLMRTLIERDASDVWINEYGLKLVWAAAARTTEADPFLTFKHRTDQDFVNRAVLNIVSGRFAETFIAASLGVPVRSSTFLFAVTCEKFAIMRTIKLRVLLMEEQTLLNLFGPTNGAAQLHINNPVYSNRLITLRAMYDRYLKDQSTDNPVLGKVELGVVLSGASAAELAALNGAPVASSGSAMA
jgi:hypothetical protein